MPGPFDGWTFTHALVGFLSGSVRPIRWLLYPALIAWEIYQLYFHYQPEGYHLGNIWLNSLVDILVFVICYEVSIRYLIRNKRHIFRLKVRSNTRGTIVYAFIVVGMAWLFWDDIFRRGLPVPLPQIPLLIGAFSPFAAAFFTRRWAGYELSVNADPSWFLYQPWPYFLLAGLIPSMLFALTIFLIAGFYL